MHSLVRRYLKTAIAFLMIGLALGIWLMAERDLRLRMSGAHVVSAHTHAILVGFVMMMILGVALWLFPRPSKEDSRYSPRAAEAAYWLISIGTALRIAAELSRSYSAALWLRAVLFTAGLLQVAGLVVFFHTMWSRIRGLGSQLREERGERF